MPTISAKIIRNPRKVRKCDACGKAIIGESARLFGSCEGDKPYAVYMHPECVQDKGSLQKLHAVEHSLHTDAVVCTCKKKNISGVGEVLIVGDCPIHRAGKA